MAPSYLNKFLIMPLASVFLFVSAAYAEDHSSHGGSNSSAVKTAADDDFFSMFEDSPAVDMSSDIIQKLGVKPVKAAYRDSVRTLKLPGIVTVDERSSFSINTKFGGWIERLYIDYRGKNIKKGDPVAEIYSPEAVAAQEEYLAFLKHSRNLENADGGVYGNMFAEDAKRLTDSARQRLKYWDISEKQIREIEQSGKARRTVTLYSPASGYVSAKNVSEGMMIESGMEILSSVNLTDMWIIADVYENDIKYIQTGSKASVSLAGIPDIKYELTADYIYPEVSQRTRTLKVRFLVSNRSGFLKPSMYTEILLDVPVGRVLSIPADSVIDDGRRKIVFVSLGEGRYEPREIVTGAPLGEFVEVRRGLNEGDTVARGANFLLDSEAQLKGIRPVKGF